MAAENDQQQRCNAIVEALQKSRDSLQEALDLAGKEPRLSTDNVRAIQQAVVKANEVYSNICGSILSAKFKQGLDKPLKVGPPLKFKKTAPQKTS
ncbi:MAG: hypothetical protein WA738_03020 [Candidatus Angelobacter sp.]